MSTFAKVFDSVQHGQIVVMRLTADNGDPIIRAFFQPEGYAPCHYTVGFTDSEEASALADTIFGNITLLYAVRLVDCAKKEIGDVDAH